MTRAFANSVSGAEPYGLWASQTAIYQRYGFAPAGLNRGYTIDTADIALLETAADAETGIGIVPKVLDSLRGVQAVHCPAHGLSTPRQVSVAELGVG